MDFSGHGQDRNKDSPAFSLPNPISVIMEDHLLYQDVMLGATGQYLLRAASFRLPRGSL